MASNTATAYGLPNPRIVDPYPVETELAKQMPSPMATLLTYWADRQAAGDQYQNELDQQHQQVRDQLVATMQNNAAERLQGYMGHPGGVALGASTTPWVFGGARPDIATALQKYTGPDEQLQIGNAAKPGSEVVKNLSDTETQLGPNEANFVTGLKTQPGIPVPVQGQIARAQGAADTQGVSIPVTYGTLAGAPVHGTVKVLNTDPPEVRQQKLNEARRDWLANNPSGRPLPGEQPPVTPSTGTTTTQPAPSTQAQPGEYTLPPGAGETPAQSKAIVSGRVPTPPPPAQQDTPAAAPPTTPPNGATSLPVNPQVQPAGNTTTGQLVIDPKIQSKVQAAFRTLPDAVKIDVLAEMKASPNGANLPIYPAKGGGLVLKGRNQFYPVQVTP